MIVYVPTFYYFDSPILELCRSVDSVLKLITAWQHLELSSIGDNNGCLGFAGISSRAFDLLHQVHAGGHLAEDHVALIQPWAKNGGDEKLKRGG